MEFFFIFLHIKLFGMNRIFEKKEHDTYLHIDELNIINN